MGKVLAEDIVFLEDYLRKKRVLFVDVRQEIIDHVCCSVQDKEGDFKELSMVYMKNHPELINNNKGYVFILGRLFSNNKTQVYKLWSKENGIMFFGFSFFIFILLTVLSRFMDNQDVLDYGFTFGSQLIIIVYLISLYFTFLKRQRFAEPFNYMTRMAILLLFIQFSFKFYSNGNENAISFVLLSSFLSYAILMFKVFIDVLRVMNRKYLA